MNQLKKSNKETLIRTVSTWFKTKFNSLLSLMGVLSPPPEKVRYNYGGPNGRGTRSPQAIKARKKWKRTAHVHKNRVDVLFKKNIPVLCGYCGNKLTREEVTFDHVIPQSQGGHHGAKNITPCCKSCNQLKKNDIWKVKYSTQGFYQAKKVPFKNHGKRRKTSY